MGAVKGNAPTISAQWVVGEEHLACPSTIPPKTLKSKGRIRGIMRTIRGLNRLDGGLDGPSPVGVGAGSVEKIPSN